MDPFFAGKNLYKICEEWMGQHYMHNISHMHFDLDKEKRSPFF